MRPAARERAHPGAGHRRTRATTEPTSGTPPQRDSCTASTATPVGAMPPRLAETSPSRSARSARNCSSSAPSSSADGSSAGSSTRLPRVSAPAIASYWCFQAAHQGHQLLVALGDLSFDLLLGAEGGGPQGVGNSGQHEPRRRGDRLKRRQRRVRVGRPGHIVRYVCRTPSTSCPASPSRNSISDSALPGTWASSNRPW